MRPQCQSFMQLFPRSARFIKLSDSFPLTLLILLRNCTVMNSLHMPITSLYCVQLADATDLEYV